LVVSDRVCRLRAIQVVPLGAPESSPGSSRDAARVAFIPQTAGHQAYPSLKQKEASVGYGLVGILVIILLVVLIFYFVRRA
jgi:hypothetical protein